MIETVMRFGSPIWRAEAELPQNAYEWAKEYKEDNPVTKPQVRSSRGGYQSYQELLITFLLCIDNI